MPNITIGRYKEPDKVGYTGWITPDTGEWVLFLRCDGKPFLHFMS